MGNGLVFLSASSMSPSTGKQLSGARRAVSHLDVIYSDYFRYGRRLYNFDEKQAFKMACDALNDQLEGFSKARFGKYLAYSIEQAYEQAGRLVAIAEKYGFDQWVVNGAAAERLPAARAYAKQFEAQASERRAAAQVREQARLDRQRVTDAVDFQCWRAGDFMAGCPASYRLDANGGYYMTVKGDRVVTSGGAECPVPHALVGLHWWASRKHTGIEPACVFEPWTKNGHRVQLGMFQLDRIDAQGNAYAGCHKFSAEEVNRLYHLLV
jgi:hypothetical protein